MIFRLPLRLFVFVFTAALAFFLTAPTPLGADLRQDYERSDYRDVRHMRSLFERFAQDIALNPSAVGNDELFVSSELASCLWNVAGSKREQRQIAELGFRWASRLYEREPESVRATYFMGLNLLLYAQSKGILDTLQSLHKVKGFAEQAYRMQPDFLFHSPPTMLGALYLFAPGFPIAFGDLDKAEKYLLEAVKAEPRQTTAMVLLILVYAKKGDRERSLSFVERIKQVPAWKPSSDVNVKDMDFWWHIDQYRARIAEAAYSKGLSPAKVYDVVEQSISDITLSHLRELESMQP